MEVTPHNNLGLDSTLGALASSPRMPITLAWQCSAFPLGGVLPSNLGTRLPYAHVENLLLWAALGGMSSLATVTVMGEVSGTELGKLNQYPKPLDLGARRPEQPAGSGVRLPWPAELSPDAAGWELSLYPEEDIRVLLLADGTLRRLGNLVERATRWLEGALPASRGFDEAEPGHRKQDPVKRLALAVRNAKTAARVAPSERATAVFHQAIADALDAKVPGKEVWDAADLSRARVYQIRDEVRAAAAASRAAPQPVAVAADPPAPAPVGGVGPPEGFVPERDWHVRARLRVLAERTVAPWEGRAHTFREGEVVVMGLSGNAGQPVRRSAWQMNADPGVSPFLRVEDVEVLEVLEYRPPTWDEAALDPAAVIEALAPFHEGAAEAVAAWSAAGLHLGYEHLGLAVRTAAPGRHRIGILRRDHHYRQSKPYEVVTRDDGPWGPDTVELSALPLDPVAAVEQVRPGP